MLLVVFGFACETGDRLLPEGCETAAKQDGQCGRCLELRGEMPRVPDGSVERCQELVVERLRRPRQTANGLCATCFGRLKKLAEPC